LNKAVDLSTAFVFVLKIPAPEKYSTHFCRCRQTKEKQPVLHGCNSNIEG